MTAPALVLLAPGSDDPRVAQVIHALRKQIQIQRSELSVNLAFLDHCPPTGPQVVSTLANRGVEEVVFVPMDLCSAVEATDQVFNMVDKVKAAHPNMRISVSRPVGPSVELLNLLDQKLRNSLTARHCLELDALVFSVPSSGDVRGNALLCRRARQWASHHKLPVNVAYCDGSGANVTAAIQNHRSQGRRAIAVGSFFLTADESFVRQAEQATLAGAVAVSNPFGADQHMADLVFARYAYGAMELLDQAESSAFDDAEYLAIAAFN